MHTIVIKLNDSELAGTLVSCLLDMLNDAKQENTSLIFDCELNDIPLFDETTGE